MDPKQDAEVASRLLAYLSRAFTTPGLAYAEAPARIRGGFDAAIYGFRLAAPPPALDGPLILRLNHPATDPRRVRLETAVHNGLAALGYPAPRVFAAETDAAALGSSFIVMARLAGHPLAHGVEGMGAGEGLIGMLRLIVGLPGLLRRITNDWVEMQLRLHALPVEPVEAALQADGIDPAFLGFDAQFERLRRQVEHAALSGLLPGVAWLEAHRPPEPARRVICHGDF
ncbi:MAG TPA: phosphotransferase, partial [Candidatus Sulfotelmatobacter sp.]|nr:phosphotransferase [Candidatus Sulfotelmatobacter sp.]